MSDSSRCENPNCPTCKSKNDLFESNRTFWGFLGEGIKTEIMKKKYRFEVGDVVTTVDKSQREVNDEALFLITDIHEEKQETSIFSRNKGLKYDGTVIIIHDSFPDAPEGNFSSSKFRLATKKDIQERLDKVKEAQKALEETAYKTGDPITLTKDVEVFIQNKYSCGPITVRKGTSAIIDVAPQEDDDVDEFEDRRIRNKSLTPTSDKMIGEYRLNELISPRIGIYLSDLDCYHFVSVLDITKKVSEHKNTKLIVPDGYIERLIIATRRVTHKDIHDYVYENLSLSSVCQKGRGTIVLLYGPPGTGKTLTAEILAEKINRPLIKLALGSLMDGESLTHKLAESFKKAKRFNAVLLLDEVDVFIRRRGSSNPVFDENTSIFLRTLEYFDGILIMTTNLVNHIDPAVFSRVHVCLEYGVQTQQERKEIWKGMFPPALKEVMVGSDDTHEELLNKLSEIKINGREIKTAIQNAVCRAVVMMETDRKKGKESIPIGVKWIHPKLFVEEAEMIASQRESLKGSEPPQGLF